MKKLLLLVLGALCMGAAAPDSAPQKWDIPKKGDNIFTSDQPLPGGGSLAVDTDTLTYDPVKEISSALVMFIYTKDQNPDYQVSVWRIEYDCKNAKYKIDSDALLGYNEYNLIDAHKVATGAHIDWSPIMYGSPMHLVAIKMCPNGVNIQRTTIT